LEGLPVEQVRVDLGSGEGLLRALEGCSWVFHAAGCYPRLRDQRKAAIERGVMSTRTVLKAIQQAKPARVVFTSSAATIRRLPAAPGTAQAGVPVRASTERDAEPWPLDGSRPLYATVKIAMEQEALQAVRAGLPAVIVNPSICIGEYDSHRLSGMLVLAYAKYRVPVTIRQMLNAVYTGDVGIGHVRAAQRGRIGERYLLSAWNLSLDEFARVVTRAMGRRVAPWCLPHGLAMAMAAGFEVTGLLTRTQPLLSRRVVKMMGTIGRLDNTKAILELGLPQTPIEEAIRRAIVWFRAHGHLS
jgi:dihydroflavonol-4-reductase